MLQVNTEPGRYIPGILTYMVHLYKRAVKVLASEALKRAIRKYDDANTKQIHLKFNKNTDAEIIEYLNGKDNVQGYIKQLIKDDMGKAADHE